MGVGQSKNKVQPTIPPVEDRRLDSLARLFEIVSNEMCVAVTVFDGNVIIAGNSWHQGMKGKGDADPVKITSIEKIYTYFQNIAVSGAKPQNRAEIFKAICIQAKYETKGPTFSTILQLQADDLINATLNSTRPTKPSNSVQYQAAKAEFENLYKIFTRLEDSIIEGRNTASTVKTDDGADSDANDAYRFNRYIDALKKPPQFLKEQSVTGVHAEIQIADYILSNQSQSSNKPNYYIGVSKLCCQKCSDTLIRINTLEKSDDKPQFDARGCHLVTAGHAQWISPDIFKDKTPLRKKYLSLIDEEYQQESDWRNTHSYVSNSDNNKKRKVGGQTDKDTDDLKESKNALRNEILGIETSAKHIPLCPHSQVGAQKHIGTVVQEKIMVQSRTNSTKSVEKSCILAILLQNPNSEFTSSEPNPQFMEKLKIILILKENSDFMGAYRNPSVIPDNAFLIQTLENTLKSKLTQEQILSVMQDPDFVGKEMAGLVKQHLMATNDASVVGAINNNNSSGVLLKSNNSNFLSDSTSKNQPLTDSSKSMIPKIDN